MIDKSIVEPLLAWYERNARRLPWRENQNPYGVWVSEIMLQQTRVEAVIPYYNRFMKRLPTIEDLANVEEEELHKLWEGLGYYSRVRNLQKAAQIICTEYQGVFPQEYEKILALPGIGPYTVGAICSIAFEQPYAAIDGNVLRVMTRLLADDTDISNTAFRKKMGAALEAVYPLGKCGAFTQSLIELGALVCVPNGEPKCRECPIFSMCKAAENGCQMDYPVKKQKKARKIVDMTVFLLESGGKIAICKRQEDGLLAGLWQFPNVLGILNVQQAMDWLSDHEIHVDGLEGIMEEPVKKHIFTHIEWHMHTYRIQCKDIEDSFVPINEADARNISHKSNLKDYIREEAGEEIYGDGRSSKSQKVYYSRNDTDLTWVSMAKLKKEIALPTAFRKLL